MLQGQFVDVRQQQQLEGEAELLEDSPVPVVIRGHHHIRLVITIMTTIMTFNYLP